MVNFGWAQQVRNFGAYPESLLESWTLRGIGYKFFFHALASAALYVSQPAGLTTILVFNALYLALCLAVMALSARLAKKASNQIGLKSFEVFLLLSLAMVCTGNLSWAQESHLAVTLTVLAVAFVVRYARAGLWIAGLIISYVATLKGITALCGVFVGIAYLVRHGVTRSSLVQLAICGAFYLSLLVAMYLTVLRPELDDLILASGLQRPSLGSGLETARSFMAGLAHFTAFNPVVGVCILSLIFVPRTSQGRKTEISLILIVLVSALAFTLIQNRYFPYHYQLLALVALMVIVLRVIASESILHWQMPVWTITAVTTTSFLAISILPVSSHSIPKKLEENLCAIQAASRIKTTMEAEEGFDERQKVLFLTNGAPNFVLTNPSLLRFLYPLPLQRELRAVAVRRDVLSTALNFEGQNIVLAPQWFKIDAPEKADIRAKLQREYTKADVPKSCKSDIELWQRVVTPHAQPLVEDSNA